MRIRLLIVAALASAAATGCGPPMRGNVSAPEGIVGHTVVKPVAETDPVPHGGDSADDPAIWINTDDPSRSIVIATDECCGIGVYDLAGREIQYRADGEINNVDVRQGFPLDGNRVALVAASETGENAIAFYRVDPASRRLIRLRARGIEPDLSVHGLCMYRSADDGRFYFFVDSEDGEVEQWEVFDAGDGRVAGRRVRSFDFNRVTESCIGDDAGGQLYLSAERKGIWRFDADPRAGGNGERVIATSRRRLVPEVEGLAVAAARNRGRYLLASSEGSSTFAVYGLPGYAYRGSFRIAASGGIDEVSGSDGIEVTTADLGGELSRGLLVAQDATDDAEFQNYKLVPWKRVERALRRFTSLISQ